ncbi:uncharacterized protein FIESC28_09781 [Fusarium coffeatum]|uniref:Uncharacterized protein n=1 Tax=Fusarium coffeatum TaxID=231269 RepID=A0A366QXI0_9HYPO|nr:uncharacterized protein FIESC28_09781 [Fusarium coffeatum]RBR09611.1 hypothetical protein FIESC28_09781 [Fusarium coffeatum]
MELNVLDSTNLKPVTVTDLLCNLSLIFLSPKPFNFFTTKLFHTFNYGQNKSSQDPPCLNPTQLNIMESQSTMIYTGGDLIEPAATPERTSMFCTTEQLLLFYGKHDRTVLKKLVYITFDEYEFESLFSYFRAFVARIGKYNTPSAVCRFARVKTFAVRRLEKEDMVLIEVTKSGHTFYNDNLIAL